MRATARVTRLCATIVGVLAVSFACAPSSSDAINIGVQTHILWGKTDDADVVRQLDAARDAGADTVRVDVGWASLEETGKGRWSAWHLARLDALVSAAEARGLKPLMTFWNTPCWASSAPDSVKQDCTGSWWDRDVELYGPSDPQDYADALAYVARRYGSRVAAWEVWNEPNDDAYFKSSDPVNEYARLLRKAYPAAKAAAPSVPVLGGALAQSDVAWTEKLYAAGVKGSHDGWSIHPYSDDRSPLDPGSDAWISVSFVRGVPAVRDVLLRHGDDKPLWLTEFGWTTSTQRDGESWSNGVDEATQARYVDEAIRQAAKWPYVHTLIYYNLKNTGADPAGYHENFGLMRWDGSRKPAFSAFRDAAAAVRPAPPAGSAPAGGTSAGPGSGSSSRSAPGGSHVAVIGSRRIAGVLRHGLRYRVTCPIACRASARMRVRRRVAGRRSVGRAKGTQVPAGGTRMLILRLGRRVGHKLARRIRKRRRLRTVVVTRVRTSAGTDVVKQRVVLRR